MRQCDRQEQVHPFAHCVTLSLVNVSIVHRVIAGPNVALTCAVGGPSGRDCDPGTSIEKSFRRAISPGRDEQPGSLPLFLRLLSSELTDDELVGEADELQPHEHRRERPLHLNIVVSWFGIFPNTSPG